MERRNLEWLLHSIGVLRQWVNKCCGDFAIVTAGHPHERNCKELIRVTLAVSRPQPSCAGRAAHSGHQLRLRVRNHRRSDLNLLCGP